MVSSKYSHRSRVSYPKVCKPPPPPPLIPPIPPPVECSCSWENDIWSEPGGETDLPFTPRRHDRPDGEAIAAAWTAEPPGYLDGPDPAYNQQEDWATYSNPDEPGDYWYKVTFTWADTKYCVHTGVAHIEDGDGDDEDEEYD